MSEVMDINATEAIENIVDRSKWTNWKFSDLADNIVEKVVPRESGLECYIGLEHLDSGSLKIRRFGETSTLKGDKLKIFKGDLIFAKRNAYLKRVAIADFDAVASAHSMVLRPNPKNVLPEFLPFFLLSEKFWQRAIEISVGSLSPTINWKVLAKQEFLLPPKDQQAQLAKLLWAMDDVIEREKEVYESYHLYKKSTIKKLYFGNNFSYDNVSLRTITELITKGTTPSSIGESFKNEGINYIKIESITVDGDFIVEKFEHIDTVTHEKLKRSQLKSNDILFSIAGALGRSTIVFEQICPANTNQALALIRLVEGVDPYYILEFLRSDFIKNYIERVHVKGAQPNLSLKNVNDIKVPLPEYNIQKDIAIEIDGLNKILYKIKSKVESSKSLQKSLINQIF